MFVTGINRSIKTSLQVSKVTECVCFQTEIWRTNDLQERRKKFSERNLAKPGKQTDHNELFLDFTTRKHLKNREWISIVYNDI